MKNDLSIKPTLNIQKHHLPSDHEDIKVVGRKTLKLQALPQHALDIAKYYLKNTNRVPRATAQTLYKDIGSCSKVKFGLFWKSAIWFKFMLRVYVQGCVFFAIKMCGIRSLCRDKVNSII